MEISIKQILYLGVCSAGSFIISILGGWDFSLQTLIILMILDFLTGVLIAGVWRRSDKSTNGELESNACMKGLIRKVGILCGVIVGVSIDSLFGTGDFTRTTIILLFISNEGISLIENLGTMGVPLPSWIKDKFEKLKK